MRKFVALASCCLSLAAATPLFYTLNETLQWIDYFSPYGRNRCVRKSDGAAKPASCESQRTARQLLCVVRAYSEFFQPDRRANPTKIYLGVGYGRTGTTSLHGIMKDAGIRSLHAGKPAVSFPRLAYIGGDGNGTFNNFVDIFPPHSPPTGMLDIPVGQFMWDVMDAFPNTQVTLTVREVRSYAARCMKEYVIILLFLSADTGRRVVRQSGKA